MRARLDLGLKYSTGITIPDNVVMVGLAGECHASGIQCVELNYSGSGMALSSTGTNGAGLVNVRIKNVGTGTTGLDLSGTFKFLASGVDI